MTQSFSINAPSDESSSSQQHSSIFSYFSNIISAARQSATDEFERFCETIGINQNKKVISQQQPKSTMSEPIFGRVLPDLQRRSLVRDVSIQTEPSLSSSPTLNASQLPLSPDRLIFNKSNFTPSSSQRSAAFKNSTQSILPPSESSLSVTSKRSPYLPLRNNKSHYESFSVQSSINHHLEPNETPTPTTPTYKAIINDEPPEAKTNVTDFSSTRMSPSKRRISTVAEEENHKDYSHNKKLKNIQENNNLSQPVVSQTSPSSLSPFRKRMMSIMDDTTPLYEETKKQRLSNDSVLTQQIPTTWKDIPSPSKPVMRLALELEEAISKLSPVRQEYKSRKSIESNNDKSIPVTDNNNKSSSDSTQKTSLTNEELDLRVEALERKVKYVKSKVMEFTNSFDNHLPSPTSSHLIKENEGNTDLGDVVRDQQKYTPPSYHPSFLSTYENPKVPKSYSDKPQQSNNKSLLDSHKHKMRQLLPLIPNVKLRKTDTILGPDGVMKPNPFWMEIYNPRRRAIY
ncbi:uncharacterized protein BX663DRAFT_499402 [Cokeromyces recurvatus]|uniref:uncharacterized protein n=1 Tax=Cokeromyces recurvatus TaxID=90255 RepID=UPI00221F40F3|nr:uncharacterized protein BX663DRAFT_499402 [Cokeromyces recurvatus]KAI7906255.1 hypothetical protein BX663DRAFT_499402 [Cokeromyces recurvatus]